MSGLIQRRSTVYFVAGFLSCLLSWWVWYSLDVVNTDAICYLQTAESMRAGFNVAMHLCNQASWPFYSFFIFCLQKIIHFSYFNTAFVLNGLFSLLSVLLFVAIIDFLRVPNRLLWFAALVILLAHEFNAVKAYVVRDHGFWAFYLLSIFFLLHYFRKPQWHFAIAWSLSVVAAALFRIEAVVFLLLLPFFIWLDLSRNIGSRLKGFLQLNTLLLVSLLFASIWAVQHADNFGRLNEIEFQALNGFQIISNNLISKSDALAHYVLSHYAESDAGWILFLMLVVWYLYCVTFNLSVIYTILVVYAWCKGAMKTDGQARFVLWAYIAVNLLITGMFFLENMFLTKRYLLALSLVLMMWIPFALESLYHQSRKWPFILVIFLMIITALSGIFNFGYSKAYLRHAGEWVELNIPKNSTFYTNNYEVMYYSKHFGNSIFEVAPRFTQLKTIENDKWRQYDYVAIEGNKSDKSMILKASPLKRFVNKRGDEVIIYRIPH